ncbi:hypothetical protein BT69DRAFT_585956 [Atractiella rhizophila]|nr:hypothetical protein BT69DRAFT_585956 [Atractiella rhizophila]
MATSSSSPDVPTVKSSSIQVPAPSNATRSHSAAPPGRMQLGGGVKLPPSLVAKMAAVANRGGNSGTSVSQLRTDQKIDPSLLLRNKAAASPVLPQGAERRH